MPSITNDPYSNFPPRRPPSHQEDQNTEENTDEHIPRPAKRARVALACQRCKKRKQKCDGQTPSCSNCTSFSAVCQYIKPPRPTSRSRDPYLKAAEARVAELEGILSREGIADEGQNRWRELQVGLQSEVSDHNEMDISESLQRPSKRPCRDAAQLNQEHNSPEPRGDTQKKEANTVVDILRDLSLEASGGYIGASSSITMSRMVGPLVKARVEPNLLTYGVVAEEHLSPKSASDIEEDGASELGRMSQDIADKLLRGYLKHISTRWPILHSTYIRDLHSRRASLVNCYETTVLHLVYACGGRFLETTGETGAFFPDRHHSVGMQYLDEILQYHDIRSVQMLILLAIYSLRAPRGPGAWTYIGLAMRTCIDLGLHRRTPAKRYPLLNVEMRKRIFWTCYCLDRQVSIILGRPFAISDRDIDVELPLDVDESVQDVSVLEVAHLAAQSTPKDQTPAVSTSLSCFIHICRLRRIESEIQQTIYRVDDSSTASEAEVENFIQKLDNWKDRIPCDARQHSADKPTTKTDTLVIDGYGYYMVYYYKCMRFLLHPLLSAPEMNIRFLKKCADACGDVCQTYKRLHQSIPVGFSLMALHSVFLAGLTLVYCTWISPQEVFSIKTSSDMNACSIVLYIITERWPGAKKYRDTYEAIKQSLLESVEESEYEPRRAIKSLYPNLLPPMARNEEGSTEVTQIVADMAGETVPLNNAYFTPSPVMAHSQMYNTTPTMQELAPDFCLPMDFQHQAGFDPSFSFDGLEIFNGFDIGDFDISRTTF